MGSAALALAIDIGGTKIAAALVDEQGGLHGLSSVSTPVGDGEMVWAALAELVARVRATGEGGTCVGLGVGTAGPHDRVKGTVSPLNIAGWRGFPLRDRLHELVGELPVEIANDGVCMAYGEHTFGAGRGYDDMVGMVVSTGVGAGLILGGRPLLGPSGNAGHVGHLVVDVHGPPCPCGGRGCVEAIASGPSLLRWALDGGWQPAEGHEATVPELAASARDGDALAVAAFARSGMAVGAAVASIAAACDVRIAVIGGGVTNVGELLFAPARAALAEHGRLAYLEGVTIVPAALGGGHAGLLGAAALVLGDRLAPPAR